MKFPPVFSAIALLAPVPASAVLLAYEPFDYAAGSTINTLNGGFGFSDAWSGQTVGTATITSPGTNHPGLATSGNRLSMTGVGGSALAFRTLTNPQGADGTRVWLSLIHQRTGPTGGTAGPGGTPSYLRPMNFALFTASERLSPGEGTRNTNDGDVWGLVVAGDVNNAATVWSNDTLTAQSFAVVRIDYAAGNDTAYLWVNPALGLEPAIGLADATTTGPFDFTRIRPFAGSPSGVNPAAEGFFDEFRMGTTFADVAPIPEPGSMMLLIAGTAAAFRRRRRA